MQSTLVTFLLLLAVSLTSFSAAAKKPPYVEGVHYTALNGYASPSPEVREFFSLYCPACASLEKFMGDIKSGLPKGMSFSRSHVNFLGGLSKEVQDELSRAYVFATNSGKGEEFVNFMFKRIHSERNSPTTIDAVYDALVDFGYSKKEVDKGMANMIVSMEQQAMHAEQYILLEEGVLSGVPTLMVNNKYIIKTAGLDRQDPIGDLSKLISYLNKEKP